MIEFLEESLVLESGGCCDALSVADVEVDPTEMVASLVMRVSIALVVCQLHICT